MVHLLSSLSYNIQSYKNHLLDPGETKISPEVWGIWNGRWKRPKISAVPPSNSGSDTNLLSYHLQTYCGGFCNWPLPSLVCEEGRKNATKLQFQALILGVNSLLALSQLLGRRLNTFKCTFQDLRPGAKAEMKYSLFQLGKSDYGCLREQR